MATVIEWNGLKWAGEVPDDLEALKTPLRQYALDPAFGEYGNFVMRGESGPGEVHFWGNFYAISAVFSVWTTDADVIAKLEALIGENQKRPDHLEAREERSRQRDAQERGVRSGGGQRRR
jgi:hypothetical protein